MEIHMQNMQMLNGNYWFQADASPVERYLGSFDDSGAPVRDTTAVFREPSRKVFRHHGCLLGFFWNGAHAGSDDGGFPCFRHYGSLLGALSKGACDGLIVAGNVVINLLIYLAVLEFLDQTLLWFGERAGMEDFTFQVIYWCWT